LFDLARQFQIKVLAITDHDSTDGYSSLRQRPAETDAPTLIPAIEMSAEGADACHLLGYFVNVEDSAFQRRLESLRENRIARLQRVVHKLNALGVALAWDDVRRQSRGQALGRPHIADALIEKKIVSSRQQAFDRFLKQDGAAYVPAESPTAAETIRTIRNAGGVPVLAHPSYYLDDGLIRRLVEQGLMGIEAYYPEHSRALSASLAERARAFGLVATGGSDFHGPRTGRSSLACVAVPEAVVDDLRAAHRRARG
jgi:3',5'-nucleoside bisphosphate phosphatase